MDCPCCGAEVLGPDDCAGDGEDLPCRCRGWFVINEDDEGNPELDIMMSEDPCPADAPCAGRSER